jgi:hypothetical protein
MMSTTTKAASKVVLTDGRSYDAWVETIRVAARVDGIWIYADPSLELYQVRVMAPPNEPT